MIGLIADDNCYWDEFVVDTLSMVASGACLESSVRFHSSIPKKKSQTKKPSNTMYETPSAISVRVFLFIHPPLSQHILTDGCLVFLQQDSHPVFGADWQLSHDPIYDFLDGTRLRKEA